MNSPIAEGIGRGASPCFEIQFISDQYAVRDALEKLVAAWERWGLPEGTRVSGEQALAEVLNNVVEHAYSGCVDGAVIVKSVRKGQDLCIEVFDNGGPLPSHLLEPAKDLAPFSDELEELPEGGFGWFMIHALTRDLVYARQEGWNRLQFTAPPG